MLALDTSVPTGTYIDMSANLPVVDPDKIVVPTLIMRGQWDGIASFQDLANFFARLPNPDKQFAVMPGISHGHALEKLGTRLSPARWLLQRAGAGVRRLIRSSRRARYETHTNVAMALRHPLCSRKRRRFCGRYAQACHRAARQLGERTAGTRSESRLLQKARLGAGTALHPGCRRDAAGGDFGQRRHGAWRRDRRRARRVRQGCAGSRHRQLDYGADDLFWYVPAASPIKSIKDAAGKTIAYATTGSSTNLAVLAFIREFGVQAKPVATGSPAATFTQTMSGQVDIGWSSPPFGVADLQQGRIRIVVRESDVPAFRNQTVRLMIANTATAEQRRDAIDRFLQAYRETLDWMYSDPAALKAYAEWVGISEGLAKEVRDQFFPKENLRLDRLSGLEQAMADAVSLKFLAAPLTKAQQDELFKYYARGAK